MLSNRGSVKDAIANSNRAWSILGRYREILALIDEYDERLYSVGVTYPIMIGATKSEDLAEFRENVQKLKVELDQWAGEATMYMAALLGRG